MTAEQELEVIKVLQFYADPEMYRYQDIKQPLLKYYKPIELEKGDKARILLKEIVAPIAILIKNKNKEQNMKKHYVVIQVNGYYEAKNQRDAMRYLRETEDAIHVIWTTSTDGNYYHSRINVVAEKS